MCITEFAKPAAEESVDKTPQSYRVLIVDDNEACAKTIMWAIEMLGHTAHVAFDGKTAIALAKTFQPEIVFLDIGLPEMNGYEICEAMRKEPVLYKTIFIAQTGWKQKEHQARSKEAGFDYHLAKPFDIEALKSIFFTLGKSKVQSARLEA